MYFLESICEMDSLTPLWNVVGFVVNAIWIGIPILLIVLGMIDLGKAVIASKEDEVKKATKAFGKRFIYAVAVFLVVWLVQFVLTTVSTVAGKDEHGDDVVGYGAGWKTCWCKITKDDDSVCKK